MQDAHPARTCDSRGGLQSLRANRGNVTTLQFLKHSCLLASGADTSCSVKLWDVRMLKDPVSFMPASLPESEHPPQLNIVPFGTDLAVKATSAVVHLSSDPEGVSTESPHAVRYAFRRRRCSGQSSPCTLPRCSHSQRQPYWNHALRMVEAPPIHTMRCLHGRFCFQGNGWQFSGGTTHYNCTTRCGSTAASPQFSSLRCQMA